MPLASNPSPSRLPPGFVLWPETLPLLPHKVAASIAATGILGPLATPEATPRRQVRAFAAKAGIRKDDVGEEIAKARQWFTEGRSAFGLLRKDRARCVFISGGL